MNYINANTTPILNELRGGMFKLNDPADANSHQYQVNNLRIQENK
jgi:hypothetical protein